jgi:hypothetical protein
MLPSRFMLRNRMGPGLRICHRLYLQTAVTRMLLR